MESVSGLHGLVAIVTAAGSGSGRAVARLFARAGAAVVVADPSANSAARTAVMLQSEGGTALAAAGDPTDEAHIDRLVSRATDRFGGIDILVNNAEIGGGIKHPGDVTNAEWEREIRVNLTAPFMLTRAVLPHMLEQRRGVIVSISSVAGVRGAAAGLPRTAAHHGLIGMVRNVAATYRTAGIRSNGIVVGGVPTGVGAAGNTGQEGWSPILPVPNPGTATEVRPEQVAAVALFLASDAACSVNGVVLPADGGWGAL